MKESLLETRRRKRPLGPRNTATRMMHASRTEASQSTPSYSNLTPTNILFVWRPIERGLLSSRLYYKGRKINIFYWWHPNWEQTQQFETLEAYFKLIPTSPQLQSSCSNTKQPTISVHNWCHPKIHLRPSLDWKSFSMCSPVIPTRKSPSEQSETATLYFKIESFQQAPPASQQLFQIASFPHPYY